MCVLRSPKQKRLGIFSDRMPEFGNVMSDMSGITMGPPDGPSFGSTRQALDSPAISTDDHLKFQGLDASAGAQLMEVSQLVDFLWFGLKFGVAGNTRSYTFTIIYI